MLSDKDLAAVHDWVRAADRWAHGAQELVAAATDFATSSRDVAVAFGTRDRGDEWTVEDLGRLAEELERDTAFLRDRYLATAANIDQYRDVLD